MNRTKDLNDSNEGFGRFERRIRKTNRRKRGFRTTRLSTNNRHRGWLIRLQGRSQQRDEGFERRVRTKHFLQTNEAFPSAAFCVFSNRFFAPIEITATSIILVAFQREMQFWKGLFVTNQCRGICPSFRYCGSNTKQWTRAYKKLTVKKQILKSHGRCLIAYISVNFSSSYKRDADSKS